MELGTAATAAASTTAILAYLNARYHLLKDLADIRERRQIASRAQRLAKQNRRSPWYLFEAQAQRLTHQRCLWYRKTPVDPVQTWTWTETYEQSCRYAQFFLREGVKPGELVATYLVNSPESMLVHMGLWAVGSAPAMINYNLGGDGLVHSLKISGGKVLLVDEDEACRGRIEEVRARIEGELGMKIIVLDAKTKAAVNALAPTRPPDSYRDGVTPDFPIFLFYTSGTTGMPKACPFPNRAVLGLTTPRLRSTGMKAGRPRGLLSSERKPDVWYDCMPLYHGTGCTVALSCLLNGVTLAIGRKFSVRNFWHDIHDSEANAFVYVGETARYLLAAPPSKLDKGHKLKAMYGNGMRPDVWVKFQERFAVSCVNEFFNSTEGMLSLLNVCRGPFHAAHVGHHGYLERRRLHNKIVPVKVDFEQGDRLWRDPQTGWAKRMSYEEGGEILIKCETEQEFVGYWNDSKSTSKRFERDVFTKGDLYYRTGDALRRDADGRWFFLDRLGDTFRWKAENVSTAEVAEKLGQFPGIVEANVYGVEVPGHDGRAGCAAVFIRPEERANFDWGGLLAHARARLPRYAVPLFVRVVAEQTTSHNNKQLKVPLRKEGVDPEKVRNGNAGPHDRLMWLRPGTDRYELFTEEDWKSLGAGKVKL